MQKILLEMMFAKLTDKLIIKLITKKKLKLIFYSNSDFGINLE